MRTTPFFCTALLILSGTGCSKPRTLQATQAAPKVDGRPGWVLLPQSYPGMPATTFAEVGSESANAAGDIMLQRKLALLHARYQLASRLGSSVQGFLKQANLVDAGTNAGNGHTKANQTVATASQGLETELVDAGLAGVTPREFWIEPGTGRLYVLVTLDREAAAGALQASLASHSRDAAAQIADSQKILDDMLASRAAGPAK
jgi:hypothetical protein